MPLAVVAVVGLFGGAALLDRFAAVERETGSVAIKLAGASVIAVGAWYLYRRAA